MLGPLLHACCLRTCLQSPRVNPDPNMEEVARDVDALYSAGQGKLGTNEQTFIDIVTKYGSK